MPNYMLSVDCAGTQYLSKCASSDLQVKVYITLSIAGANVSKVHVLSDNLCLLINSWHVRCFQVRCPW